MESLSFHRAQKVGANFKISFLRNYKQAERNVASQLGASDPSWVWLFTTTVPPVFLCFHCPGPGICQPPGNNLGDSALITLRARSSNLDANRQALLKACRSTGHSVSNRDWKTRGKQNLRCRRRDLDLEALALAHIQDNLANLGSRTRGEPPGRTCQWSKTDWGKAWPEVACRRSPLKPNGLR